MSDDQRTPVIYGQTIKIAASTAIEHPELFERATQIATEQLEQRARREGARLLPARTITLYVEAIEDMEGE